MDVTIPWYQILWWRYQFTLYGWKKEWWGLWDGWVWSSCWTEWYDDKHGLNSPELSAEEEREVALAEGEHSE